MTKTEAREVLEDLKKAFEDNATALSIAMDAFEEQSCQVELKREDGEFKFVSAEPDLSGYSDRLWRNAYERGKRDAQAEQRWIPEKAIEQVCRDLQSEYNSAVSMPWVHNPIAFALYQVWKKYDSREDGES